MGIRRFISRILVLVFLLTLVLVPSGSGFAKEEEVNTAMIYNEGNYQNAFVPGQVIVVFKKEYSPSKEDIQEFNDVHIDAMEDLTKGNQGMSKSTTSNKRMALVKLKSQEKQDVLDSIKKLKNDPKVEYAEPNYIISTNNTIPNDPYYNRLYAMDKINAPQLWDRFTGSSSVVVGVIDSGIDYNHQDLSSNMWNNPGEIPNNNVDDDGNGYIDDVYGWDFVNNDNSPMDDNGHGTHCAGTIAGVGNNGIGVAGVAWNTRLAALKFLDSNGFGSTANAILAVNYANAKGFPITNNSWGGGAYSQALRDAISSGGLFVASAGNNGYLDNDITPQYPASYDCGNIIAVASTDSNDNIASSSHYGLTSVDLAAPGVNIWSCAPGNSYQYMSGTSMAAPHVAGAAALLKGYRTNLSANDLKAEILSNVDEIPSLSTKVASRGRLSVNNLIFPRISLRTISSPAKYVCADDGGGGAVVVDRTLIGPWEIFRLISLGNNQYALRTDHKQYVCAERGGGRGVIADRTLIGPWETFTLIDLGSGQIALQTSNGQYLCAENGGGGDLVADRVLIGPWETFVITYY